MDESINLSDNKNINKSYDIKNIYNIKKEDVIVQEYMNVNNNSTINIDNKDQVNIYIENRDLNKKTYNCYTCNIQIYNYSFFRYHFKSEWHKYNLKRKLLNLNAVNELAFNEKVQILKKSEEGKGKGKGKEQEGNNLNTSKKHSNSNYKKKKGKKNNGEDYNHKKVNNSNSNRNSNNEGSSYDIQKVKYATKEEVLLNRNVKYDNPLVCFFDNRIFNTIDENIKHMNDNYTFYIPDQKYVTDIEKVLLTIGKKIYEENKCIYCFRYSKCVKSLQSHMICKSHTKVHTDFFVFIQKYYDFSKTYVDLLNKYINSKEDKELLIYMLHKRRKDKISLKCQASEKHNKDNTTKNYGVSDDKQNVDNVEDEKSPDDSKQGNVFNHGKGINSNVCTVHNGSNVNGVNDIKYRKLHSSEGENIDDYNSNNYNKQHKYESDNNDDYKVKEEDLSKNLSYDTIYEVLEEFGYIKPELNEYNNLILPDGSEAINRKIAYIFKQKLPLENRTDLKCNKMDVMKKKESNQYNKKYKYYIDIAKKYGLDLNVKTNKLNRFYKSDTMFFL
ncbi:zinc finger protein [Plasmodium brasilianum]|uniref:Zinc finger protein, putative n=2 Tax=Plasmodium (Plasmodium) TaxID=418103 RepID=A0A1A8VQL3_PLAMA|nr:zinc finger protein [Plasmodium brasilianum]SBS81962.1 zinc finger protein, putative [Plasmodium malariae]